MPKIQQNSLRSLAAKYHCSYETLRLFKKQGIDIKDESAVISKLSENPEYVAPNIEVFIPVLDDKGELGLTAAIKRLQKLELISHNSYLQALENNSSNAGLLLKHWQMTLEALRKAEESNPDILQANQNSVSKGELAEELGKLFRNLRQDLDALPLKISTRGHSCGKEELAKIVLSEITKIKNLLLNAYE